MTEAVFIIDACGPDAETLRFGEAETMMGFDPTEDVLPAAGESAAGEKARAEARRYFGTRAVTFNEAEGTDHGGDLLIRLRIARDRETGRVFSFLQASD